MALSSWRGTFSTSGISALLALIGIIITAILVCNNVRGNILLGILITWGIGIICQLTGVYVPNPDAGFASSSRPTSRAASRFPRLHPLPSSWISPTSSRLVLRR